MVLRCAGVQRRYSVSVPLKLVLINTKTCLNASGEVEHTYTVLLVRMEGVYEKYSTVYLANNFETIFIFGIVLSAETN